MTERPLCALHLAVGKHEECPGEACVFWEKGGAVMEPGCIFERVQFQFEGRPGVASWLLGIRHALESTQSTEDLARVRSSLNAFLPPGLHE